MAAALLGGDSPSRADDRYPVFFEDPDSVTAQQIQRALDLLHKIEFSNHTTGREILERIGYWAVEPCVRILEDGSSPQRRNSALVLGTILDYRGLEPLYVAARDVRQQFTAVFSTLMIGKFRDPASLAVLRDLVASREKDVRRIAAILSLVKLRTSEALDIILNVARDPREQSLVRQAAIFGLGFFRGTVSRDQEDRRSKLLERATRDPNAHIRRSAVLAIALLGRRSAKPLFESIAKNPKESDAGVLSIALLALGRFPVADQGVTQILLDTIENPRADGKVRLMAAFLLKDRKDPNAVGRLVRLARARIEQDLEAAVVLALSNFENPGTVKAVVDSLVDPKDQVKVAAAIACTRFTDPDSRSLALAKLELVLEKAVLNTEVREDLELARRMLLTGEGNRPFNYLGNKEFAEDLAKEVEEKLLDMVNTEARRVLGIESLTPWIANLTGRRELRRDDKNSDLRDLKAYLDAHPYFVPEDVPEPQLATTPREPDPATVKETEDREDHPK